MWVLLPVQSTLLWTTLEENEFFVLQQHKGAHTMLQGVIESFRSTLGGEKNPYSYRIVLKSRGATWMGDDSTSTSFIPMAEGGEQQGEQLRPLAAAVAAVGDDEAEMREHWSYLTQQLLPAVEQFDQRLRSEEAELRRFLHTKLAGLALREREKHKEEKEDLILQANGISRLDSRDSLPRNKRFHDLHRATKVLKASKQAPWLTHFPDIARTEELTFST